MLLDGLKEGQSVKLRDGRWDKVKELTASEERVIVTFEFGDRVHYAWDGSVYNSDTTSLIDIVDVF